jgi:hypothetical protein
VTLEASGDGSGDGPGDWWARSGDVALVEVAAGDLDGLLGEPGVAQALRDGIERGYEGELPAFGQRARVFRLVRVARGARETRAVGVLALREGWPRGASTVIAVAVAPSERGRSTGARALLAVRDALEGRVGGGEFYSVVPRSNGRGLYFMLRCGFAPCAAPGDVDASGDGCASSGAMSGGAGGVTWFRYASGGAGADVVAFAAEAARR